MGSRQDNPPHLEHWTSLHNAPQNEWSSPLLAIQETEAGTTQS